VPEGATEFDPPLSTLIDGITCLQKAAHGRNV
jgi:hypothetical protein